MTDIEAAWEAVHAALERLPGWEATRPQWHPDERRWVATAFYAGHIRRFDPRPAVEARGTTEAEALRSQADTGTCIPLDGVVHPRVR